MGWGDFGSNGSVHWRIGYENSTPKNTPDHVDYDNMVRHPGNPGNGRPEIGGSAGKQHRGYFRITARFASAADADAFLRKARVVGNTVELDVPVRPYNVVSADPGDPNGWEVRVDW